MIPFSAPDIGNREYENVLLALSSGSLQGGGSFSKVCESWLESQLKRRALLTHSCTAALEMAALLAELGPGDEVIMPSFTFVSTANAVALRGATPVFVDIRADTFNIDEQLVEQAVSPNTKAIIAVHYAGVCAEMDKLQEIADEYQLLLIEDAAQAMLSTYHNLPAGGLADIGCFSFHETKNVTSGEGGAITIRSPEMLRQAHIIRDKGTNRIDFNDGRVDKYSWVSLGSSYSPSDILAALLHIQFVRATEITSSRLRLWEGYHTSLSILEAHGVRRPLVPQHCKHNGHIYHLLLPTKQERTRLQGHLSERSIQSAFHFVPLHSSLAGQKFGKTVGSMDVTDRVSDCLLRLPLYTTLGSDQDQVITQVLNFYA